MDREAGPSSGLIPRVEILGVTVSAIDMGFTLSTVAEWIASGARHYVCVTGVHGVMESQTDAELMRIHNRSGLTVPDGMPLVWCGRHAGAKAMTRVYGPDLMLRLSAESIDKGWSHFFYGSAPGVADELAARLSKRFPGLSVAGTLSPPFRALTDAESDEIAAIINGSGATIVWVGLSTPKQERWMAEFRDRLTAPVLIGVGAAFDIHAGRLRQAPEWMRRSGLEWLFRLLVEPRRLWRRYLRAIPVFLAKIARNRPRMVHGSEPNPDSP